MRQVTPISLDGVTPRDLSGEPGPDFDVVDPRELVVDDEYQRNPSARTLALVRRIVVGWSWAKFKPPVVIRVDGVLEVIDGQHTAIAAASHGGIGAIPVIVVAAPGVSDRAAAFVSHTVDRVQASPLQVHRAAVVAGDPAALAVEAACRDAGVALLHSAPDAGRYTLCRRAPKRARAKAPAPAVARAPAPEPRTVPTAGTGRTPPRPGQGRGARISDELGKVITPSAKLAAIVGHGPILRSDAVEALSKYVRSRDLYDAVDRRVVVADAKLRAVFGRDRFPTSELAELSVPHVCDAR